MKNNIQKRGLGKLGIIGIGRCGNEIALMTMLLNCCDEMVLVNRTASKAEGEALDMTQFGTWFGSKTYIHAGTYEDCADCDLIVLTCGAATSDGLSREDNYQETVKRFAEAMEPVMKKGFNGLLFFMTYQEERAADFLCELTGLPDDHVFAIGYNLYTERLRSVIAEDKNVRQSYVETYCLGAQKVHFAPASQTKVDGKIAYEYDKLQELCQKAYGMGKDIVNMKKGANFYGISAAFAAVINSIMNDEDKIHTICVKCHGEYGIDGKWATVPVRIGRAGIKEIIELDLTDEEKKALYDAAYRETMEVHDSPYVFRRN